MKPSALVRARGRPSVWLGLGLGCLLTAVAFELPYVNWQAVAPPIDERPMMIRQDAKGDGRFLAGRSGRRRHQGIDLVAALDSPVRAIQSGTVTAVGVHQGLGRFVEIEHRQRLHSLYAHLNSVRVEPGARVRQGAVIGAVGKTGNARHPWITPHVHLEVWRGGEPQDPQSFGLRVVEVTSPPADRERLASANGRLAPSRAGDGSVEAGGGD